MLLAPTLAALLALAGAEAAPTSSQPPTPYTDSPSTTTSPLPVTTGSTIALASRPRHRDDSWNPDLRLLKSHLATRRKYAGLLDESGRQQLRRDWAQYDDRRRQELQRRELWEWNERRRRRRRNNDEKEAEVGNSAPAEGYPTV